MQSRTINTIINLKRYITFKITFASVERFNKILMSYKQLIGLIQDTLSLIKISNKIFSQVFILPEYLKNIKILHFQLFNFRKPCYAFNAFKKC
jgi:hypothetical protein